MRKRMVGRVGLAVVAGGLLASACAPVRSESTQAIYRCDDGQGFVVNREPGGGSVRLVRGTQEPTLTKTWSITGDRYEAPDWELLEFRDGAVLKAPGEKTVGCSLPKE